VAKFSRGDVIWARVEKTAEGGFKRRPVLVISSWPCAGTFDDLVCLCGSTKMVDAYKTSLSNEDFESGGFENGNDKGFIRPSYMTNVVETDFSDLVGRLNSAKVGEVMSILR
jgi:hypothetical protein